MYNYMDHQGSLASDCTTRGRKGGYTSRSIGVDGAFFGYAIGANKRTCQLIFNPKVCLYNLAPC
jgi:hypothetical protein